MKLHIPKHCNKPMRRLYEFVKRNKIKGKKVTFFLPIGWICNECKMTVLDEKPIKEMIQDYITEREERKV